MKKMKKLLALVIAMAMVLAMMSMTAFAAEGDYSITVINTEESISIDGKTYSAYKVFDLTYDSGKTTYAYSIDSDGDGAWAWNTLINGITADADGVYTNPAYGLVLTPSAGDPTVYVVTSTMTEAQARDLADALQSATASATAAASGTASGQTATINLSEAGYYAVYGTAASADPKDGDKEVVAALALTSTDPTATVNPKASIPTVDKEIFAVTDSGIDEALLDDDGKAAVAKVGSTVSFKITSSVPDLTGYDDYTWIATDTITEGLTYVADTFKLTIGGTEVAATGTDSETGDSVTNYTLSIDGQTFTLNIPFGTLGKYAKDAAIVLTYDCTVNSNALTYDYDSNTVSLEYSTSPYNDNTNHTPDKKVYVIDLNLDVNKVAESISGSALSGAEFKLYREVTTTTEPAEEGGEATTSTSKQYYKWDTTANKVTWVDAQADGDTFTTEDGKLTQQVRGLDAGTYYFEETKAPQGYNLLDAPVEVVISVEESTDSVTYSATYDGNTAAMTNGTIDLTSEQGASKQPVATGTIVNNGGSILPSTGGIGTTIFYVVGTILVIGAGVILITRRRMDA